MSIILVLLIFLFCGTHCLSLTEVPKIFPYQAHSFNDLDIANKLLMKKVKYFKFDASLANRASCLNFSTWQGDKECLNLPEYAQDMCCIAMRGDASSQPNFYYPFNTSAQFIKLFDQFLTLHETDISILFIAIDFQFGFSFENQLAEKFMFDLATLMEKFQKLHVTTKGQYILEFDRVCRFHSDLQNSFLEEQLSQESFSGIECTSSRKHISSQNRFFLQSSSVEYPFDKRDYKERYRNFNTIFREIDNLCANGFPTWPNKYPEFPLIFWEPSNEMQIQSALAKLLSPECQKKHNRTMSGIALASNIDPEMFQIGMKMTISQPFSSPWRFEQNKLFAENVTDLKMEKLTVSSEDSSGGRLVIYTKRQNGDKKEFFLSLFKFDDLSQEVNLQKEVQLTREVVQLRGALDKIIAISKLNEEEENSGGFSTYFESFDSNLQSSASLKVDNFVCSASDGEFIFYLVSNSNPNVFTTFKTDANLKKQTQYKGPVQMRSQKIKSIQSMLLIRNDKGDDYFQFLLGDVVNKTWIAQIKQSQQHAEKNLTFGTNSRISRNRDNSILILLENSYTHGGILMNNNGENTCLYHNFDSLKPLATLPHLVNGIQASLQNLLSFMEDREDQIVTACHPTISFSKFLNGASTSALCIWQRYILATKFIPITQQDFLGAVFSGGSNFQSQLRKKKGFLLLTKTQGKGPKNEYQKIFEEA